MRRVVTRTSEVEARARSESSGAWGLSRICASKCDAFVNTFTPAAFPVLFRAMNGLTMKYDFEKT